MDNPLDGSLADAEEAFLECFTAAELRYAYRSIKELASSDRIPPCLDDAFARHLERVAPEPEQVADSEECVVEAVLQSVTD